MGMPGRKFNAGSGYRYGFNGKENDNEAKGEGNQQDYGMRIYDPRLGRFLSVDPLSKSYPWYTPYQFAGNKPIQCIDLDGLEEYYILIDRLRNGGKRITIQFTTGKKNKHRINMQLQRVTGGSQTEETTLGDRLTNSKVIRIISDVNGNETVEQDSKLSQQELETLRNQRKDKSSGTYFSATVMGEKYESKEGVTSPKLNQDWIAEKTFDPVVPPVLQGVASAIVVDGLNTRQNGTLALDADVFY